MKNALKLEKINFKCPNCNHDVTAHVNLNELARIRIYEMVDKILEGFE